MSGRTGRPGAVVLVIVLLGVVSPPHIPCQQQNDENAPAPYEPDEFPRWARDIRRAEIIALGAYPVAMLVTGFGYQVGRFAYRSARAGEIQPEYAPGVFSPDGGAGYTQEEQIGVAVSGAIISVGVALVDYFLGRREARRDGPDRTDRR
jgi:hypothetical protein